MMIATQLHPSGVALKPAALVTIRGEQFALCRPHLPGAIPFGTEVCTPAAHTRFGWDVVDLETGACVGSGPTKADAVAYVDMRLAGLNPGSLQRAREAELLRQGVLS